MSRDQLLQIARFLTVGVGAAAVHFSVVVYLVHFHQYLPLIANVAGFVISFQVSYWGHRIWTFSGTEVLHRDAYPKLVLLQLFNFSLNELLYFILLSLHLPYQLALIIVLAILPAFTYLTSKHYIFQD